MNNIEIYFRHPLLLLLLIPAVLLAFYAAFRLPKAMRFSKNRVISLALHLAILMAAVCLISGLRIYRTTDHTNILVVVDLSDSMADAVSDLNAYVEELVSAADENTKVGVIVYANGNVYTSELSGDGNQVYDAYEAMEDEPDASATDIAGALEYASEQFADGVNKRLILLSDGVETDGDAVEMAKTLAASDIRIDTLNVESMTEDQKEVQVQSLVLPESVDVSDTIDMVVNVESTVDTSGTLQIYDQEELVYEETVDILTGSNQYATTYEINGAGVHSFYAVVTADTDTEDSNNQVYAYVDASGAGSILVVDGTGEESAALSELLGENYDVTVIGTGETDAYMSLLRMYDEVILMNVSNSDLAEGFADALASYVNDYGGGLLTTGGDNTYVYGSMSGTAFDEMLPVDTVEDGTQTVALMLVIDSSSSMEGTNMEMAKEGAIASINAMSDTDYVGIISFSGSTTVSAELTSMTEKDSLIDVVENLQNSRGTYLYDAVYAAYEQLENFDADVKHVIILSDGNPTDSGYDNVVQLMADSGITTSTIALGSGSDTSIMENLATIGGGRFYSVTSASDLPDTMFDETVASQGDYWNDGTFTPVIRTYSTELNGVVEVPELGGYMSSSVKEDATLVLATEDNAPVYAKWEYGKGSVGSLMTDLNGDWSEELLSEQDGQTFIENMVASLLPETDAVSSLAVHVTPGNYSATVQVTADLEEDATIGISVTNPDGEITDITTKQVTQELYEALVDTSESGVYTMNVVAYDGDGNVLDYTSVEYASSYSSEYDYFAETDGEKLLYSVSQMSGGALMTSTEELLAVEMNPMEQETNPSLPLTIGILGLYLGDILIRKVRFRFPRAQGSS